MALRVVSCLNILLRLKRQQYDAKFNVLYTRQIPNALCAFGILPLHMYHYSRLQFPDLFTMNILGLPKVVEKCLCNHFVSLYSYSHKYTLIAIKWIFIFGGVIWHTRK